jgi:hypothetical protein
MLIPPMHLIIFAKLKAHIAMNIACVWDIKDVVGGSEFFSLTKT